MSAIKNFDFVGSVTTGINAVMAALAKDGIGKDRQNVQQGYKFRGIDDVYNVLSRALVDAGLTIVPHYADRQVIERTTAKGNALFYVTVSGTYDVIAKDGSAITVGPFFGEAMDSGDKATNKAMSASFKYLAMQLFCIPTEGDNDADSTTHEVKAAPRGSARGTLQEVYDGMDDEAKNWLGNMSTKIVALVKAEGPLAAVDYIESENLTNEDKMGLWFLLDSNSRSTIKREQERRLSLNKAAA